MSKLEIALRNALAKGDQGDPLFRRRVYEAAANAMQKSLEAKGGDVSRRLQAQNLQLAEAIKTIEADLKQARPTASPDLAPPPIEAVRTAPKQSPDPVVAQTDATKLAQPTHADEMPVAPTADDRTSLPHVVAEPRAETVAPQTASTSADPNTPVRKKAPYATILAGSIAVAALGIGLLWVITTGAFQSADERDTSVPNPSLVLESESFEGRDPGTSTAPATLNTQAADEDGWTRLFTPADPTTLVLVDGATAEITSDSFGDYARLITPNEVAQVQIDVPLSVLRNNVSGQLQLSIIARSDEGKPTQMSITCDFGSIGGCGRHRFNVGQAESEYLIQINLPDADSATAPGRINLATDIEGQGRAVKLLSARIRNSE